MKVTKHASVRQQQRGIPPIVIDLLVNYGTVERSGKGATTHYFDKTSRRRLRAYTGRLADVIEPYLDCYAIVSDSGDVITVAHRLKKLHH